MRAGFIKLAMSDDGPTALEIRNLRAAARASQNTGAVIAVHTIGGRIAKQEMDVLEEEGLDLSRFIWVHAQTEPDSSIRKEAAQRLAKRFPLIQLWGSLDVIDGEADQKYGGLK